MHVGRRLRFRACLLTALFGCGSDDLFVNAALELDDACEVRADDEHVVQMPVFDVRPSTACDDAFVAQLWVDNPNDERARVTGAEIRLTNLQRQTLAFNDEDPPLPNPFLVSANGPLPAEGSGVVELEVIPAPYAQHLAQFVDSQLLASVALFGTTADGSKLDGVPIRLVIEICDGCRTLCASDPEAENAECNDPTLGPLRTYCVDPDC